MAKDEEIKDMVRMLKEEDARGLDGYLYRYEDKGLAMLAIALYHGIKELQEKEE